MGKRQELCNLPLSAPAEVAEPTLAPAGRGPDRELEERIRALLARGDRRQALRLAVVGYHAALKGFLRARLDNDEDAREVLADLWSVLCESIGSFRGEGPFLAFAQRIAAHRVGRFLRARQTQRTRFGGNLGDDPAVIPRSDTHPYAKSAVRARLARLLDMLSPAEREVLNLHLNEGLTWDQIGKRLNIAGGTLRRRHSRLLGRLRECLAADAAAQRAAILAVDPDRALFQWLQTAPAGACAQTPSALLCSPVDLERIRALRARLSAAEEAAGLLPSERGDVVQEGAAPRRRRRR